MSPGPGNGTGYGGVVDVENDRFLKLGRMWIMARLLSIKDVAAEYGPSIWFWRTQVWKGKIKNCGSDRRHLLDRRDIETLIEKSKG